MIGYQRIQRESAADQQASSTRMRVRIPLFGIGPLCAASPLGNVTLLRSTLHGWSWLGLAAPLCRAICSASCADLRAQRHILGIAPVPGRFAQCALIVPLPGARPARFATGKVPCSLQARAEQLGADLLGK